MARARPPAVCSRALARTPPATTNAQALDGSWRVRYSNCVPPSNGQLGPFVGLPLQVVDIDKGSYQNRLAFLNRSLPSPPLLYSSVILDPFRCICEGSLKHEHTRTHTLCVGVGVGVSCVCVCQLCVCVCARACACAFACAYVMTSEGVQERAGGTFSGLDRERQPGACLQLG